ncbi:DUF2000 family protein [Leifsonia sp. LS1]|uniref:DUF2000 family protein n=1 Tax=Leifsonia sp. LS1 TaxID=2828483 RepID=UPI001CFE0E0D|nr:DUF2000 family protein [Leifsonia sp. LS1]
MSSAAAATPAVRFDTKIVVLLSDDLAAWQELNVTAFLISGIATSAPDLVGEPYRDGDGAEYLPMLRQPVVVMTGDAEVLAAARVRAASRDVTPAVYTRDLFATGHDEANREAVAAVASDALDLVGIAVRGPRNTVDRIVKGARLHG